MHTTCTSPDPLARAVWTACRPGGGPHGTKCMVARARETSYSDINGKLHSMCKDIRHLASGWMQKLQVRLPMSEVAVPRAFSGLSVATAAEKVSALYYCSLSTLSNGRLARKNTGASSTPHSQGGVVSDQSHNTCRPSFLAVQAPRLLGSIPIRGRGTACTPGMARDGKRSALVSPWRLAPATNQNSSRNSARAN